MNDVVSKQFVSIMYCLLPCLLLLYSCILLKMADSNASNSSEIFSNSSREQVRPLALISHLNRSTADLYIQEANSMFVSNTSFDDLVRNNDTHQMFLKYRERKRQVRLKTIQQEILQKLGFEQEPNITSNMSEHQRMVLVSSYDKLQEINNTDGTIIEI